MTNSQSKLLNEINTINTINEIIKIEQKNEEYEKYEEYDEYDEYDDCNDNNCICWLDIQWKECNTYDDLLKCMKKYIKGEIINMPLSTEPYKCEDSEFIKCLEKLINIGIFVVDMQPFRDEIQNNTRYRQREYLNFAYKLKPNQKLSTIMEKFDCNGIYYIAQEYYRCNNPNCKDNCSEYYQTEFLDKIDFNNDEIWISKHQKLKNNVKSRIYKKTVHICFPEDIEYGYNEFARFVPDFYENLVIFNVWNNIWERVHNRYMIDKVIECFK
jgi:hypothetical protein